jgi:predicted outer membrane repeat protein
MKQKYQFLIFSLLLSFSLIAHTGVANSISFFAGPTPDAKGILYIKQGGNGDGSSWNNAYGNFQLAMTSTNTSILQIWVAAGTYTPNYGFSFSLKNNAKIYGGFAGTENDISQRDLKTNITILKGNRNTVIKTRYLTATTVLDGFTISDGFTESDGSQNNGMGGGMNLLSCSLTISNCIFKNNKASSGGGIYNWDGSPIITNCTFTNNGNSAIKNMYGTPTITNCNFEKNISPVATISNERTTVILNNCNFTENSGWDGGAMYNELSTVTLTNCRFVKNISKYDTTGNNGGAAMYNVFRCNINVYNCSFIENSAVKYGGAIVSNNDVTLNIVNSLFANNTAGITGQEFYNTANVKLKVINTTFFNKGNNAIFYDDKNMEFINCIVWAKIDSYSQYTAKNSLLLDKKDTANGNIDATGISDTQIFNDTATGNFSLLEGGIALNKGNNTLYDPLVFGTLDLSGRPRINETTIDLGAYESKNGTLGLGNIEKPTLRTYPNPVKGDFFTIENASVDGNAVLYDMTGKQIKSVKIENGKAQMNVSDLSKGMYLLKTTKGEALKILVE